MKGKTNGAGPAAGSPLVKEMECTARRWPAASAAQVDRFVKERVGAAAEVQSRRVLAAAQAELCNRALARFVELLYDETEGGILANIGVGGRVLIPMPWSRTRYAAYGLTDHGGRVLRAVVVGKLERQPPSLRLLSLAGNRWWLNLKTYGSLPAAGQWLQHTQVSPDAWLRANDRLPRRGEGKR